MWTTPARTRSQAITTLTATAAINGDPTASMPRMMSEMPHRMDSVDAERTIPDGVCCAIEASLRGINRFLTEGVYLKEMQERQRAGRRFKPGFGLSRGVRSQSRPARHFLFVFLFLDVITILSAGSVMTICSHWNITLGERD